MKKITRNPLENLVLVSQVGISMLVPIIGGVYLGRWLDIKFDTQPIFLFVCILLGVGGAFSSLFKLALRKPSNDKKE